MNPPNLTALDAVIAEFLANIAASQQSYFAAEGVYERQPSAPVSIPYAGSLAVTVNEYVGPDGAGYEAVFRYDNAGSTWFRTVNFGPETQREDAWWKKRSGAGKP